MENPKKTLRDSSMEFSKEDKLKIAQLIAIHCNVLICVMVRNGYDKELLREVHYMREYLLPRCFDCIDDFEAFDKEYIDEFSIIFTKDKWDKR